MLFAILWGITIGLTLGLLGGGGALIAIPVMIYSFHFSFHAAVACSLFLVTLGSLPAVLVYWKQQQVDWHAALLLGIIGGVGAYLSSLFAEQVPDAVLLPLLIAIMLISAYFMLNPLIRDEPSPETTLKSNKKHLVLTFFSGLLVGVLTGLLGVGGGFFLVPLLVLVGKLPPRRAIATSLVIITLNAAFGTLGHLKDIPWHVEHFSTLSALLPLGSVLGVYLSFRLSQVTLKRAFGVLILALAGIMVLQPPH